MATWIEDLETQLRDLGGSKKVENKSGDKMESKSGTLMLFGVIILLVGGLYYAYKYKMPPAAPNTLWQQPYTQQQPTNPWPYPQQVNPNVTLEQKVELLKKQYETIDTAAQKIWERTKWNSDRITLLATLNNHNLVVMQGNLPKTELILLNDDWTINRMPDRIRLDSTDQEFLKKFLKK